MIIEVDEYKKRVEGYTPERSELFHRESAKLADIDFTNELKTQRYKRIIFMGGGTASGKTEFAISYLNRKENLVYDGTFSNGFKAKTDRIVRYSKNNPLVKVVLILPVSWERSFEVFIKRDRKMSTETFFRTHINSKLQVAEILESTKYKVEIYLSFMPPQSSKLQYMRVRIKSRKAIANLLRKEAEALNDFVRREHLNIN